jgi:hypothetical protein
MPKKEPDNQEEESPSNTLKLSKPMDSLQGKITSISFEEPTGRDVRKIGMPFRIINSSATTEAGVDINTDKVARYIERCCNLGAGDADNLSLPDFVEAQNRVLGFFGQSDT